MAERFAGKVALVTGGGSGIGRGIAQAFARHGATVVVAGRRRDPLLDTVKLIEAEGGRASAVTVDVSRASQVAQMIQTTVAEHGGLHIAVNNAGYLAPPARVGEVEEPAWEAMIATNLTGTWLSMKHEIAHMRGHGGGVIVNIASIGVTAVPGLGAYGATKAGVLALTRAAARDHIREGIRINAVSPGPIATEMSRRPGESDQDRAARLAERIPLGRIGTVQEVAAAVLWLASEEATFMVGQEIVVDGGVTA